MIPATSWDSTSATRSWRIWIIWATTSIAPAFCGTSLELATWEDYGLFHHIDVFLEWLPECVSDVAVRELARIITELRAADLDYQVSNAQRLRRLVLASADDRLWVRRHPITEGESWRA